MKFNFAEERAILGSLIYHPEARERIIPMLTADDFYITIHREIFKAVVNAFNKGQPIDANAFEPYLREYVLKLKNKTVDLEEAVEIIDAVKNGRMRHQGEKSLEDIWTEFLMKKAVSTGYKELDAMLGIGGFSRGEFIIIKGADRKNFALNIVVNALKSGKKVLYYSTTANLDILAYKILSIFSGVSLDKLLNMSLSDEDAEKIEKVDNRLLQNLKVKCDISQLLDIELASYSTKPDIIVIDSLEVLTFRSEEDCILGKLKSLAKQLDVPIVVLSSEIPGEPDVVMNVSADNIIVEKNRNGEIGKAEKVRCDE
jgi:replicative DNA helicase